MIMSSPNRFPSLQSVFEVRFLEEPRHRNRLRQQTLGIALEEDQLSIQSGKCCLIDMSTCCVEARHGVEAVAPGQAASDLMEELRR